MEDKTYSCFFCFLFHFFFRWMSFIEIVLGIMLEEELIQLEKGYQPYRISSGLKEAGGAWVVFTTCVMRVWCNVAIRDETALKD